MIFIGIDNGQKGGIAVLEVERNKVKVKTAIRMPLLRRGSKTEIDFQFISKMFESLPKDNTYVVWEIPQFRPHDGKPQIAKAFLSAGKINGIVIAAQLSLIEVTPIKWYARLGLKKDKNLPNDKPSLSFVSKLFPRVSLMPGHCSTPQDGISDAIALAWYGKLEVLGNYRIR